MRDISIRAVIFICLLGCAAKQPLAAQAEPDPYLLSEINKIKAVDNHTHVPKLVGAEEKDDEYDALPCGGYVEPSDDPSMARLDNPLFLEAWQKLYGYRYKDKTPEHMRELLATKQSVKQKQGDNYPIWVLDQLGTEYMMANRIAMGRGLVPISVLVGALRRRLDVSPQHTEHGGYAGPQVFLSARSNTP